MYDRFCNIRILRRATPIPRILTVGINSQVISGCFDILYQFPFSPVAALSIYACVYSNANVPV